MHAESSADTLVGTAILESRDDPRRTLEIVVEARTEMVQVTLGDVGGSLAFGSAASPLRPHGNWAATAVARVPLGFIGCSEVAVPLFDANLALTWAVVPESGGFALDVAGTAYVFDPSKVRPELFVARRRDPFNTLAPWWPTADPAVSAGPESGPADRGSRRIRPGRPSLRRRPFADPSGMVWPASRWGRRSTPAMEVA